MNSEFLPSITQADIELLYGLRELSKHNGLIEFGDDFVPARYTDPNYVAPHSGHAFFITSIALLVITCLVVAARYYARVFIAGGLGGDDIAIGVATLLFIGTSSMYIYAVENAGFGYHVYDLGMNHVPTLLKITYSMPILYNLDAFFIKLSLLLFYRRLFGGQRMLQRVVKFLIVFEALFTLGYCMGLVLICIPVKAWWDLTLRADNCPNLSNTMVTYVSLRSISVFTDVVILCLPMKLLWDLKIPARQKFGLAVIYGLGIMACVTAILRLAFLPRLLLSLDVSWNVIPVAFLDIMEQALGIITASLPALTAFIAKIGGTIVTEKPRSNSVQLSKLDDGKTSSSRSDVCQNQMNFDFLSLAYDPDSSNGVHTRAWASNTSQIKVKNGGFERVRERVGLRKSPMISNTSDENLMGSGINIGSLGISKTTTVEVLIDRR